MTKRVHIGAFGLGIVLIAAPWLAPSMTAAIVMPPTHAGLVSSGVTADSLKPDACVGPTPLAEVVSGSGTILGTGAHELILGSAGPDSIDGGAGDDCILSGDGVDVIDGGDGYDVCIGTVTTTFTNCEVRDPA